MTSPLSMLPQVDIDDPEFWTKCVGLTVPVEQEEKLGR